MKKILLIASLLFISCIYAQQQGLTNLRLDRSIIVNYDVNGIRAKEEIAYDANGNQTLYIDYQWNTDTQSFIPNWKYESTFDANGNETLNIDYSWDDSTQSIVPNSKYEATYDAKGNFSFYLVYSWDDITQTFVPNSKYEATYDAKGNFSFYIVYSWDDITQTFVLRSKQEYTYDANGNQTSYIDYSWDETTASFVPSFKRESTYDANGNRTSYIDYYSWDDTTQSFVPSYKYEYSYDTYGNQTLYINYSWNTDTQSFVPDGKRERTYDGNGNQTLDISYSWDETTASFVPNSKTVSTYSNGFITSTMIYKWYSGLGVYKPSFKTEYTTILDTDTQLHRMGVTYQYDTNFNVWNLIVGEEFKSYYYYTKTELSTQTIDNNLISLYPNPTSKLLYVSHPELNSLGIQIVDVNGKQMYSGTIQKDVPLDISSYSLGMYLVTIENKETKKKNTYKIIKK